MFFAARLQLRRAISTETYDSVLWVAKKDLLARVGDKPIIELIVSNPLLPIPAILPPNICNKLQPNIILLSLSLESLNLGSV